MWRHRDLRLQATTGVRRLATTEVHLLAIIELRHQHITNGPAPQVWVATHHHHGLHSALQVEAVESPEVVVEAPSVEEEEGINSLFFFEIFHSNHPAIFIRHSNCRDVSTKQF